MVLCYGSPGTQTRRVKYVVGYITPLFSVPCMSLQHFHGSDSCLWVATNVYFQNFLYFGKPCLKYQVSILTMSLDIYFQIFLGSSIFYLFLKGANTVQNYIPCYNFYEPFNVFGDQAHGDGTSHSLPA